MPDIFVDEYAPRLHKVCAGVYMVLCRRASKERWCFPGMTELGRKTRYTRPMVIKAIKILEEWGIIQVTRSKNNRKERGVNRYYLVPESDWKPLGVVNAVNYPPSKSDLPPNQSDIPPVVNGIDNKEDTKKETQIRKTPKSPERGLDSQTSASLKGKEKTEDNGYSGQNSLSGGVPADEASQPQTEVERDNPLEQQGFSDDATYEKTPQALVEAIHLFYCKVRKLDPEEYKLTPSLEKAVRKANKTDSYKRMATAIKVATLDPFYSGQLYAEDKSPYSGAKLEWILEPKNINHLINEVRPKLKKRLEPKYIRFNRNEPNY